MIRLKESGHANTAEFLQNAIRIAEYYGFMPLDDMKGQTKERDEASRKVQQQKSEQEINFARRDERALASEHSKARCLRGALCKVRGKGQRWHLNYMCLDRNPQLLKRFCSLLLTRSQKSQA
jgi:hypothetical protein